MNVLDLFSGIGGFSLGLERAGMRTIAFCEIDPYCSRVLAKHWPGIPILGDIRRANLPSVAVITAGFPCQDVSPAGKRSGINGDRSGLWRAALRAIGEVRPQFAILENSAALIYARNNEAGIGQILGELATIGYDAVWHCIPASYVGARHERDRVWIVGYLPNAAGERFEQCWRIECEKESVEKRRLRNGFTKPSPPRMVDGITDRTHRNRAIGNAVVPQIPEIIGRAIMTAAFSAGERTK